MRTHERTQTRTYKQIPMLTRARSNKHTHTFTRIHPPTRTHVRTHTTLTGTHVRIHTLLGVISCTKIIFVFINKQLFAVLASTPC